MGIIKRLTDNSGGVGVVYSGKDKEEVAYCHRCLEMANIRSKLGNRIYLPDPDSGKTVIPPDHDKWRQCHLCGTIYPRYEVKQEAKISPFVEGVVSDNPFDFGNSSKVHAAGESRKFDRSGRTQRKKKFKQDLSQYKEDDIKEALKKGAKLVSYEENMPK